MCSSNPCVLVVNPNTNEATTRMLVAFANEELQETGLHACGVTAAEGPAMITDPLALRAAVAHVVAAARTGVAEHRPRAVIVGAIGDPGVAELRAELPMPVVGIGEAAVAAATSGGRRFGMITTTERLADSLLELVARNAPGERFTGLRLTASDAETLARHPDRQLRELDAAARAARDDGAEAIIVAGGPLSGTARELAARSTVPIIEPVPAAVAALLETLALQTR